MLLSDLTCFIRHWRGALSGLQRKNFVPCLNRVPVKWSYETSATSSGRNGCHSVDRLVDQRLGPPGARPVNPGASINPSSLRVSSVRLAAGIEDVNPTWCTNPPS